MNFSTFYLALTSLKKMVVQTVKRILKQEEVFLSLMAYRATPLNNKLFPTPTTDGAPDEKQGSRD